jgi:ABC-type antimicrobial peptide transport system permease subunit
MKFRDIAKMCFDSLRRRKGRTILTVLGVFIGCTSIIIMVSIGAGMRESQDQMISNMGDVTVIEVYGGGEKAKLDDAAVETFRGYEGVKAVMPKMSFNDYQISMTGGLNDRYACDWGNVVGLDIGALEDMGYEFIDGRAPAAGSEEVVVGQYFAYNFRDTIMPEGRNYVNRYVWDENGNLDTSQVPEPFFDPLKTQMTMHFKNYEDENFSYDFEMNVVGVLKEDYGKGWETSEGIMMDVELMRKIIKDINGNGKTPAFTYNEIYVKVTDIKLVADVEEQIKDLGYYTYSMQSVREELEKQTRRIELMLGGLGAISLLVAAIGITNTMTMSVSERTKEIGIMKALGCYIKDIRMLFLMEAGSIGLIGGVIGLIFSFIVSIGINLFSFGILDAGFSWEMLKNAVFGSPDTARVSVISLPLVIFALVFALFVGLISGYSPANKAVKVSALEAIRKE